MKHGTKIEWTQIPGFKGETLNPMTGCSHVSEGCRNCYAEREWIRLSKNPKSVYFNREFTDVQVHQERFEKPFSWKTPRSIFVNSMSDMFHESISFDDIREFHNVMADCPHHIFIVLTKRPESAARFYEEFYSKVLYDSFFPAETLDPEKSLLENGNEFFKNFHGKPWPLKNFWLGVSIEDQRTAINRVEPLLKLPAGKRIVSYEPALERVDLRPWMGCGLCYAWPPTKRSSNPLAMPLCGSCALDVDGPVLQSNKRIDWVIAGGESGPASKRRPMALSWARWIRDQCAESHVPFFMKQINKVDPIPEDLLVRQFPPLE